MEDQIVGAQPLRWIMPLLRVEIVTPRSADLFIQRIRNRDPLIDHLCLELVHWGFNEVLDWISKVHIVCKVNPKVMFPAITIHGYGGEMTQDMLDAFENANVSWMERKDQKNKGKDCATIIQEMVLVKPANKFAEIDYPFDLSNLSSGYFQQLPDAEFHQLIQRSIAEFRMTEEALIQ